MISVRKGVASDQAGVVAIVRQWPKLFVDRGVEAIKSDFAQHLCLVVEQDGEVRGFSIWQSGPNTKELLWLAVHPSHLRQGIATALLVEGLADVKPETDCLIKMATGDSEIPGTTFDPQGFEGASLLYRKFGFRPGPILRSFWGEKNHAQVWRRTA